MYRFRCPGIDVESRACGHCAASWGKWGVFGACSSTEPACLIGQKKSMRSCLDEHGNSISNYFCAGEKSKVSDVTNTVVKCFTPAVPNGCIVWKFLGRRKHAFIRFHFYSGQWKQHNSVQFNSKSTGTVAS